MNEAPLLDFQRWIGRTETLRDRVDARRINALLAAMGRRTVLRNGDPLPPFGHWLYFWDVRKPGGLGLDGHPKRGGFLPPVDLPRRMWAGGDLTFGRALRVGASIERQSIIRSVDAKSGRSGNLIFVQVEHRLSDPDGVAIIERQDIVYRDPPTASTGTRPTQTPPLPPAQWEEPCVADSVLLFRYSALTMNGHRIHYDQPYAVGDEGYAGLVVHGPLQATLLMDLAVRRSGRTLASFSFRGLAPATDRAPLLVCGNPVDAGAALWIAQAGRQTMSATTIFFGPTGMTRTVALG